MPPTTPSRRAGPGSLPTIAFEPRRERPRAWILAGCVLLAHLALAAPLRGPMLFGDETAYLGMARFLAGRAPDLQLASPAMRHGAYLATGYSAVLLPFCALGKTPLSCYRAALAVNAICAAAAFLLLATFARRICASTPGGALLAALAACAYPAFTVQPLLAWSESLLFVLVPALVLAVQRLAERRTVGAALLLALTAGGAYWVHQRTVGLVALTLLALAVLYLRFALPAKLAATGAAGTLGLVAMAHLVNVAVWARVSGRGTALSATGLLADLLRPQGLWQAALSALGQLWYLAAATAGLGLLGAASLARLAAREPTAQAAEVSRRLAAGFALAAGAVLFLTSAAFVIVPDRVDKLIYGRYWEPALGLFLAAAVSRILTRPPRWTALATVALAPLALGAALVALRGGGAFTGLLNQLNILGIAPWTLAFGRVRILRTSLLTAACGFAALLLARRRPAAATAVLALLFAAGGLFVERAFLVPANRTTQDTLRIPTRLDALPAGAAVAYDEGHLTEQGFYAYPFWIDRRRLLWFDSRRGAPPATLVISARNWPQAPRAARLLYPESFRDQGLWVLPGAAQDRLATAGALVPADPAAPLPLAACRAGLERRGDPGTVIVAPAEYQNVSVRLIHRGTGAPWVSANALPSPVGAVRIGVRWFRGGALVADRRAELPYTMSPGEEAAVEIALEARTADGRPLPAGLYEVRLVLLQELVRWFDDTGGGGLVVPVEVREGAISRRLRELGFAGGS